MKTLSIANVAWVATIRSFVDGDIFRETNIDLSMGDVADRLGYLKATVDSKGGLATDNTWTQGNIFDSGGDTSAEFIVDGDADAILQGAGGFIVNRNASFTGDVAFSEVLTITGGISLAPVTLADAAAVLDATKFHHRVPTLNASRNYSCPPTASVGDGHTLRIEKLTTAATHEAIIKDADTVTTIAILTHTTQGWVEVVKRGSNWRVAAWGGNAASLSTGV